MALWAGLADKKFGTSSDLCNSVLNKYCEIGHMSARAGFIFNMAEVQNYQECCLMYVNYYHLV